MNINLRSVLSREADDKVMYGVTWFATACPSLPGSIKDILLPAKCREWYVNSMRASHRFVQADNCGVEQIELMSRWYARYPKAVRAAGMLLRLHISETSHYDPMIIVNERSVQAQCNADHLLWYDDLDGDAWRPGVLLVTFREHCLMRWSLVGSSRTPGITSVINLVHKDPSL